MRCTPCTPGARGDAYDQVSFVYQASGTGDGTSWDVSIDPASGSIGGVPHYNNNTNYSRRIIANQFVREFWFFVDHFDTEAGRDTLSFGEIGTVLQPRSGSFRRVWEGFSVSQSLQATPGVLTFQSDMAMSNLGFLLLGASVCCEQSPGTNETPLDPMVRYQGVLLGTNDVVYLQTPCTDTHAAIAMWGDPAAGNNFDVFVKCNGTPTPDDFDFSAESADTQEFLHLDPSQCACPGTWHVAVNSRAGAGWFNIVRTNHYAAQHRANMSVCLDPRAVRTRDVEVARQGLREAARFIYAASEGTFYVESFALRWQECCCDFFCPPTPGCEVCYGFAGQASRGCAEVVLITDGFSSQGIAHEMAHAFFGVGGGGLLDEYVPGTGVFYCGHSIMIGNQADGLEQYNFCYAGDHGLDGNSPPPISMPPVWDELFGSRGYFSPPGQPASPWQPTETPDNYSYADFDFNGLLGAASGP